MKEHSLIWDWPTRAAHWLLAASIMAALVTGWIGSSDAMDWHMRAGYVALGTVLFRLLWGLVARDYAAYRRFPLGLARLRGYLRGEGEYPGHNPLGVFSVIAMLLVALIQAGSGLFAYDEVYDLGGPLMGRVSEELVRSLTELHEINSNVMAGLVGLHIAALVFYARFKGRKLAPGMITGSLEGVAADGERAPVWLPLVLAALVAVGVYVLVQS